MPPADFQLPTWDADGLFGASLFTGSHPLLALLDSQERHIVRTMAERTRLLFEDLGRGREQFGVIHADFILGNCRWHGHHLRMLDFDDCGWGSFLYDLAPVLGNLEDFAAWGLQRNLLNGYRSVRSLLCDLEEHLPLLMAARHVVVATWLTTLLVLDESGLDVPRHLAVRMEAVRHDVQSGKFPGIEVREETRR